MGFFKKIFGASSPETPPSEAAAAPEGQQPQAGQAVAEPEEMSAEEHERIYKFETLRDDGLRAMQVGQFSYAVKCLETALQYEDDEATCAHLAEAYVRQGAGRQALPLLEKLLQAHPDRAQLHAAMAEACEQAAEWQKMEHHARQAVELQPDDAIALYLLCRAQRGMGNHAQAVEGLTQLIGQGDRYVRLLQLRADSYFAMGQVQQAEADLQQLAAAGEATEETYLLQGKMREAQGNADGALESYAAMLEANPFSREATLRMAQLYMQAEKYEQARTALSNALEMQPDFAEAYRLRAQVWRQLGNEQEARADEAELEDLPAETDTTPETVEDDMNRHYKTLNPFGF